MPVGEPLIAKDFSREERLENYRKAIPDTEPYKHLFESFFKANYNHDIIKPVLSNYFPTNKYYNRSYFRTKTSPAFNIAEDLPSKTGGKHATHTGLTMYTWTRPASGENIPGKKIGITLCLSHGLMESQERYGHVANYFLASRPEVHTIIGFDQMNHGRSPFYDSINRTSPPRVGIFEHWVSDLMEFMEVNAVDEIYGHSCGGLTGMEACRRLLARAGSSTRSDENTPRGVSDDKLFSQTFNITRVRMVFSAPALYISAIKDDCFVNSCMLPMISCCYDKGNCVEAVNGMRRGVPIVGKTGDGARVSDSYTEKRERFQQQLYETHVSNRALLNVRGAGKTELEASNSKTRKEDRDPSMPVWDFRMLKACSADMSFGDPGVLAVANTLEMYDLSESVRLAFCEKNAEKHPLQFSVVRLPKKELSNLLHMLLREEHGKLVGNANIEYGTMVKNNEGNEKGKKTQKDAQKISVKPEARMLILHGTGDKIINAQGSQEVDQNNRYVQVIRLEGYPHESHNTEKWHHFLELANIWFRNVK